VKVLLKLSPENEVQELGISPPTAGSHSCSAWIGQQGHMPLGRREHISELTSFSQQTSGRARLEAWGIAAATWFPQAPAL